MINVFEPNVILDRLSLLAYIEIYNSFNGMYMAENLRVWYLKAEVRLRDGLKFEMRNSNLDLLIQMAYDKVVLFYQENRLGEYLIDSERAREVG